MIATLVSASLALLLAPPATPAQQAFERLKKLEGTWQGMAGHGGDPQSTKVIYKVTGAGSALVETQFPGSEHEMVTVYHLNGDKLMMTHYCAAQNQPTMQFKPGKDANVLNFAFVSGSNMKPTDAHRHNLTIRFKDANHIVSEWAFYSNGKAGNVAKFEMARVPTTAK